jgi:hypothetical protein
MARPLRLDNLLRKAIANQDWNLVEQALNRVTATPDSEAETPEAKPKAKLKKNLKDALKVPIGTNKFVDDFTIATEFIEGSKKLAKKIKGKEYRPAYKPLTLNCVSCNKPAEILPAELSKYQGPEAEDFNCNKCLQGKLKHATK